MSIWISVGLWGFCVFGGYKWNDWWYHGPESNDYNCKKTKVVCINKRKVSLAMLIGFLGYPVFGALLHYLGIYITAIGDFIIEPANIINSLF